MKFYKDIQKIYYGKYLNLWNLSGVALENDYIEFQYKLYSFEKENLNLS